jgi:hypothetical protein
MNNNSLVISLNGGLGNQLFMLFTGISKSIDEKRDFLIYLENNKRKFYFNDFLKKLYNKVINYNNINITINSIYNEPFFHFKEIPNNYDMIRGYFQSYKYFSHNYENILKEIDISSYLNNYKINLKSIAIHFRLGDYLELTHYHRVLSFIYYIKAINYLKNKLSDFDEYVFVIFGEKENDNIINDYIKHINFNLDKPINYIKIYDRYKNNQDFEDFLYMSDCNHIIMANSTYSWFASYLRYDNNKNIIYPSPSKWFADNVHTDYIFDDLFLNDWIKIDF